MLPAPCLHLTKLAVGVPTLEAFETRVAQRRETDGIMSVRTRSFPKRAAAIVGQGSLYWVVAGLLAARQIVRDIAEDTYDDGSRCTRIDLEPTLIRIVPRSVRPFQGWRYLEADAAPPDLAATDWTHALDLPPTMARDLRELCLL